MCKRFVLAFIIGLSVSLFTGNIGAQVPVYLEDKADDSINVAVKNLFTELKKASPSFNYSLNTAALFKNDGILVLRSDGAKKYNVKVPTVLSSYGAEGIYIKGTTRSITIVGNSAYAINEAIYIYLEQLGFSYFAPGDIWHIIPKLSSVFKSVEILTKPDFEDREISLAHGTGGSEKIASEYAFWTKSNRLGGAFDVRIGHAYDEFMLMNIPVFKEHPEYFAQPVAKGTLPENPKFNVANKDLIKLAIDYSKRKVAEGKSGKNNWSMISMSPSDGEGFCTTSECKKIGNTSDQVYYLTNAVAKDLQRTNPGIWVGCLAYLDYIVPPRQKLEPNVFVMLTNGFNRSKYNIYELLKQWQTKATKMGIYDYLSVYEWDYDLPGQVGSAKPASIQQSLQKVYNYGGRVYQGESVMGWVSRTPGQYIISKLLWNRNADVQQLKADFFEKAYGPSAILMRKMYDEWEDYPNKTPAANDLANWLYITNNAYVIAGSDAVRKRIDQVKTYLHYLVLYTDLKIAPTQEKLEKVLSFAYRNFDTPSFSTLPTLVSLPNGVGFSSLGYYASKTQAYRNDNRPFGNEELQSVFKQDLQRMKKLPDVNGFGKSNAFIKLSSLTEVPSPKGLTAPTEHAYWEETQFVIQIPRKDTANYFEITSNLVKMGESPNVTIDIYLAEVNLEQATPEKPLLHFEQSKTGIKEKFSLNGLQAGYYFVKVNDHRKMFILEFSKPVNYSVAVNARHNLTTTSAAGVNVFYFYVPKGTKNFRVNKTKILNLYSPAGRILKHDNNIDEQFNVDIQPGEEGLWILYFQAGSFFIEGIPPYFGSVPSRMLLPSYLKK